MEKITREQVDKVFGAAFGFPAREADKQIVEMLGGTREALADYVWDHWLGKPRNPNVKKILEMVNKTLDG